MATVSAMYSSIINYRTQEEIALAKRTTDVEWVSENAMNGNYSTHNWRVDLSTIGSIGNNWEIVAPLASLSDGATAVSAVGFKYSSDVSNSICGVELTSCFGADLQNGGSISYSAPGAGGPLGDIVVWGSHGFLDIVVILYHGA